MAAAVDGTSSASVVAVDPVRAAFERDRLARKELASDVAEAASGLIRLTGVAHTVPYELKVWSKRSEEEQISKILKARLDECNDLLNSYNPASEVSKVNRLNTDGTEEHVMSETLCTVLQHAWGMYHQTQGTLDPATAPVYMFLKDWVQHNGEALRTVAEPPPVDADVELRTASSFSCVEEASTYFTYLCDACTLEKSFTVDWKRRTIQRKHRLAQLDLGGMSKGYTVDRVIETLVDSGFENAFLDWGGDMRASGYRNSRNEAWRVGVTKPPNLEDLAKDSSMKPEGRFKEEAKLLGVFNLNGAIATSGDYENLIVAVEPSEGGTPRTPSSPMSTTPASSTVLYTTHYHVSKRILLQPSFHDASQVTVFAASCLHADCVATYAFLRRSPANIRASMDRFRYAKHRVTDYLVYVREGERLSRMAEIGKETKEMKEERIKSCIPARVIVVGGGLAGCSAAVEAANCGATVVLLEKTSEIGGNSAKATSGINGWGSEPQTDRDIKDYGALFERDTHKSGLGGRCEPGLVRVLSNKSGEAISWLSKEFDLPLTVVSQLGGHCRPRTHRAPDKFDGKPVPVGYTIMSQMREHIEKRSNIRVLMNATVESIISSSITEEDGSTQHRVHGVRYRVEGYLEELLADAVILSTGGFGYDSELMGTYAPHLAALPTTNGDFTTGDGVKLADAAGAVLVDMDKIQLHPTGFLDPKRPTERTKYLGPEALRGSGGILVNKNGERFVNELGLRSTVSNAILKQGTVFPGSKGSCVAYCILSPQGVKLFGRNSIAYYRDDLGLLNECVDVTALAEFIGADTTTLSATLEDYGSLSDPSSTALKRCELTGKTVFPAHVSTMGPFVVGIITPVIHYTMGGCLISPSGEVQSEVYAASLFGRRRPILGLFGAGEVTGGVHGNNRLGGNSLLECVVFGRISGDRAATILQKRKSALSEEWTPVVLREVVDGEDLGAGSRILRFNLPGACQFSGLRVGQFVGIKAEWDGRQLLGYYSPITLPNSYGLISVLVRVDKGALAEFLNSLQPGDAVYMKACGGLIIERLPQQAELRFRGRPIRNLGMIAGGTGIAPMLQLLRAALRPPYLPHMQKIRLIYCAKDSAELSYRSILQQFERQSEGKFRCCFVLEYPPPGWTDGVGFVDFATISDNMFPPTPYGLVALCGPPPMQRAVIRTMEGMGYDRRLVRTVDEPVPTTPFEEVDG